MSKPKRNTGLTEVIREIKRNIHGGFDRIEERISELEKNQAITAMDVRDLQIQTKAMKGVKQSDIAVQYGLSEARVSQIIRQNNKG